ncbi:MAG: DUF6602 domain-containing protein [Verrucomicrobiota bacterium]|jgi:hypothetical protein
MNQPVITALLSWARELNSRADRVRQIITDKHWLSDGHHKEYVLKEFLSRHLSTQLSVSRGFICAPDPEIGPSGEIDLLIIDPSLHPPWFNEGGLIIAPAESVIAQIHVKTSLGSKELCDVLCSVYGALEIVDKYIEPRKVWSAGFFFHYPGALDRLAETVLNSLQKILEEHSALDPKHLPTCIVCIGGPAILLEEMESRSGGPASVRVRGFEAGEFAPALFLCSLVEHMSRLRDSQAKHLALTNLLARVDFRPLFQETFTFKQ